MNTTRRELWKTLDTAMESNIELPAVRLGTDGHSTPAVKLVFTPFNGAYGYTLPTQVSLLSTHRTMEAALISQEKFQTWLVQWRLGWFSGDWDGSIHFTVVERRQTHGKNKNRKG